ncbi:hypothetical protein IAR55_005256 [Kwoniella newhampshirensis]|uniref:Uncharacterized protein n=1 Tax=Kwoniella newhampshirensis TaxID=1651941 RepID=A0AAW0YYY1_9TREE
MVVEPAPNQHVHVVGRESDVSQHVGGTPSRLCVLLSNSVGNFIQLSFYENFLRFQRQYEKDKRQYEKDKEEAKRQYEKDKEEAKQVRRQYEIDKEEAKRQYEKDKEEAKEASTEERASDWAEWEAATRESKDLRSLLRMQDTLEKQVTDLRSDVTSISDEETGHYGPLYQAAIVKYLVTVCGQTRLTTGHAPHDHLSYLDVKQTAETALSSTQYKNLVHENPSARKVINTKTLTEILNAVDITRRASVAHSEDETVLLSWAFRLERALVKESGWNDESDMSRPETSRIAGMIVQWLVLSIGYAKANEIIELLNVDRRAAYRIPKAQLDYHRKLLGWSP